MNLQNLFNQFMSQGQNASQDQSSLLNQLPGGLMGGAAAGGVMALLLGSKSARKFAGKAATYGGAAVLAGLAYSGYKRWKANQPNDKHAEVATLPLSEQRFNSPQTLSAKFQVRLIKAMISAAHADGYVTQDEQRKIFTTLDQMNLPSELKAPIYDALREPETPEQLALGIDSMEQKIELYLASCLAIDVINAAEQAYLDRLAAALQLPADLALQLQADAQRADQSAA